MEREDGGRERERRRERMGGRERYNKSIREVLTHKYVKSFKTLSCIFRHLEFFHFIMGS
jgi:hypothetical protein